MPSIPNDFDHVDLDPEDEAIQAAWAAASTPGRQTYMVLDHKLARIMENHWGGVRQGAQICTPAAQSQGGDGTWTRRVRYWPSLKFWTLGVVQENWRWTEEVPEGLSMDDLVYTKGNAIDTMVLDTIHALEMRLNQIPYGTGMIHDPSATFDNYITRKVVSSGASWDDKLSRPALPNPFSAGSTSLGGISSLPTPRVPMDTVMITKQTQREDLGMFLRWLVPGHQNLFPDYILTAFFGQYGLGIAGDGKAYLFEWCRQNEAGAYRWRLRKSWQYCPPQAVCNVNHTMTIFPVRGQYGEPYIIFSSRQVASGTVTWGENHVPTQEVAYHASDINRQGDLPESANNITKRGFWSLDIRRDLRVAWSVGRLMFWESGQIVDAAWEVPPLTNGTEIRTQYYYRLPITSLFGGSIMGSVDFLWFNARDPGYSPIDLTSPTPNAAPMCVISFKGGGSETINTPSATRKAQSYTPVLYGYRLWRDPVFDEEEDDEVYPPIKVGVRSFSAQDPGPNPKMGGGTVETADFTGNHPRLKNRGHIMAKIVCNYWPPAGQPQEGILHKVTLFSGVALRWRTEKLIPDNDDETECPTPRKFMIPLAPMASVGAEVSTAALTFQSFTVDETHSDQTVSPQPWKVTEAIRTMLATRFSENHIEIEELDIRLFGALGISTGDLLFESHDDIIARCEAMARDYLGRYLVFDLAAGPLNTDGSRDGAWRILKIPDADAPPVIAFFTSPQVENFPGMDPCGYKTDVEDAPLGIPLADVQEQVAPPECNHVWVFAAPPQSGERYQKVDYHCYNFNSYKVPGSSIDPSPNSPHFIGYELLHIRPAPELWLSGDAERTRQACELVARRILFYAGSARRIVVGHGPLGFIWDEEKVTYRAVRYGDPCTLNGETGWFVASCSPNITLDTNQVGMYELHKLIPHTETGIEEEGE
jgi:hypothetical protein